MLAPAVGVVDFKDEKGNYKSYSDQLKSIHSTINGTDFVLGKGKTGLLSKILTPTDFGYSPKTFSELNQQYLFLEKTDFTGQKSHDFKDYIINPKFIEILKKFKLKK